MADNVINEKYVLSADVDDAIKASKAWEAQTKKSSTASAKSIALYTAAAVAATAAVRGLASIMADGVKSALDYQKTTAILESALKDAGVEIRNNTILLNQQSAALEEATGVSDENLRSMQSLALSMGVGVDQVDKFVRAALRMSRATGRDANESMKQLLKTLGGTVGELGEVVPAVKDLTEEQLKAGGAADLLNKQLESQLELADNLEGNLVRLKTQWANLLENLGTNVTESGTVLSATYALTAILKEMNKTLENTKSLSAGAAQGLKTFVSALGIGSGDRMKFAEGETAFDEERTIASGDAPIVIPGLEFALGGGKGGKGPSGAGGGGGKGSRGKKGPKTLREKLQAAGGNNAWAVQMAQEAAGPGMDWSEGQSLRAQEIMADAEALEAASQQLVQQVRETETEAWATALEARADADDQALAKAKDTAQEWVDAWSNAGDDVVSNLTGAMEDFATAGLDALISVMDGEEVVFEEILKNFLKSQGQTLYAQGITHMFTGAGKVLMGDPTGAALIALGGAETAAGVAMAAGSTAISIPDVSAAGQAGAGGTAVERNEATDAAGPVNISINTMGRWGQREVTEVTRMLDDGLRRGYA